MPMSLVSSTVSSSSYRSSSILPPPNTPASDLAILSRDLLRPCFSRAAQPPVSAGCSSTACAFSAAGSCAGCSSVCRTSVGCSSAGCVSEGCSFSSTGSCSAGSSAVSASFSGWRPSEGVSGSCVGAGASAGAAGWLFSASAAVPACAGWLSRLLRSALRMSRRKASRSLRGSPSAVSASAVSACGDGSAGWAGSEGGSGVSALSAASSAGGFSDGLSSAAGCGSSFFRLNRKSNKAMECSCRLLFVGLFGDHVQFFGGQRAVVVEADVGL